MCLKGKILSIGKIGIKMLICLLTIDIKMFICLFINWYQDFSFSIGICSLLIGINMNFIDIFLIGIIFDLTPYWHCFCFRPKGGEHLILFVYPLLILCFEQKGGENVLFLFGPLCWWLTKRGRKICVYMHVLYACFCFLVCRLIGIKSIVFSLMFIGIKSFNMFHCFYVCLCIHV